MKGQLKHVALHALMVEINFVALLRCLLCYD